MDNPEDRLYLHHNVNQIPYAGTYPCSMEAYLLSKNVWQYHHMPFHKVASPIHDHFQAKNMVNVRFACPGVVTDLLRGVLPVNVLCEIVGEYYAPLIGEELSTTEDILRWLRTTKPPVELTWPDRRLEWQDRDLCVELAQWAISVDAGTRTVSYGI